MRYKTVPVNHAKILQKFSFIEILELSDFHSLMNIGAKMVYDLYL